MKCGHSANAEQVLNDGTKIPACAICGCTDIEDNKPKLHEESYPYYFPEGESLPRKAWLKKQIKKLEKQ